MHHTILGIPPQRYKYLKPSLPFPSVADLAWSSNQQHLDQQSSSSSVKIPLDIYVRISELLLIDRDIKCTRTSIIASRGREQEQLPKTRWTPGAVITKTSSAARKKKYLPSAIGSGFLNHNTYHENGHHLSLK